MYYYYLQIYSPNFQFLDFPIFIEIIMPNKPSSILGTIYKHPSMKPYKFNNEFLEPFLSKIKAEDKVTFLPGDSQTFLPCISLSPRDHLTS